MAPPLCIAHRGASVEAPENTLAAFARAIDRGVDGVELDVRLTRDGVPVVIHDGTLRRLTGVPGRVATLTWRELQTHRVAGQPIPRLDEVLDFLHGRAVVQIEIKRGVPAGPVIAAVRAAASPAGVVLASFYPTVLTETRALAPELPRMLISTGLRRRSPSRRVTAYRKALIALGAVGLSIDHRAIDSGELVAALKAGGFSIWCWTVNEPPAMRRLAAWGVDALLSDNPALLVRTLSRSDKRVRSRHGRSGVE